MRSTVIYSIIIFFVSSCVITPLGDDGYSVLSVKLDDEKLSGDAVQIANWEIFLHDETTSSLVLHEARIRGEEGFESYRLNVLPKHSYEMDVFVNDSQTYHSSSSFVSRMSSVSNVLPGVAHLNFSTFGEFVCAPLITYNVMQVSVERFANRLPGGEDMVVEEVYLACAAVSSDYVLENVQGYNTSVYPQISESLDLSLPPGESCERNIRLYAFPLLDDAPPELVTSLVFKTSQGYYHYPLPRSVLRNGVLSLVGPGMSLVLREVIFCVSGGSTPFERRVEVVLDGISVISRPSEDPVVIER